MRNKFRFTIQLIYLGIILFLIPKYIQAANWKTLNSDAIALKIKQNADAVIRYDSTFVNIVNDNKVVVNHKEAITILNENGSDKALLKFNYTNYQKINDISATLIDKDGKVLKSIKTKDFYDRSLLGTSFVLFSDERMKLYNFNHKIYPYTIVYEYNMTYSNLYFMPNWYIQDNNTTAVEHSFFQIKSPLDFVLKSKNNNLPPDVLITNSEDGKFKVQNWSVSNIAAFYYQPYGVLDFSILPYIEFNSLIINLDNYTGSTESWESFGKFNYELNKDRTDLTPAVVQKVHELIDQESDTYTKVQKLYEYVQKTTRYIANEYGINGWQTFDAKSVCNNGYGDCKGLTNFLLSLLKEANITSYAALVNAGVEHYYKIDPNVVSPIFNHVILCIPNGKDSIWVECTSATNPAGYLGGFTSNRKALLITDQGGKLVNTPNYNADVNFVERKLSLSCDLENENLVGNLENIYSSIQQDNLLSFLKSSNEKVIKESLIKKLPFNGLEIHEYNYDFSKNGVLPIVKEQAKITLSSIINQSQNKLFIDIPWFTNPMKNITTLVERTRPIVFHDNYRVNYEILLVIPKGYKVAFLPTNFSEKTIFGNLDIDYKIKDGILLIDMKYLQKNGTFDKNNYTQYQTLYNKLENLKKIGIVLEKV